MLTVEKDIEMFKHDYEESKGDIFHQMEIADGILVDDDYIRYFNYYQYVEGVDMSPEEGVALDAGEYQFSLAELQSAEKVGKTWFVVKEGEEYQITFERCIPF